MLGRAEALVHRREGIEESLDVALQERDAGAVALDGAGQEWIVGGLAQERREARTCGRMVPQVGLAQRQLLDGALVDEAERLLVVARARQRLFAHLLGLAMAAHCVERLGVAA